MDIGHIILPKKNIEKLYIRDYDKIASAKVLTCAILFEYHGVESVKGEPGHIDGTPRSHAQNMFKMYIGKS